MEKTNTAGKTNWNKAAYEYMKRGFSSGDWHSGYQPLLRVLGNIRGKRILDYGCGVGKFSTLLSSRGADVVGVDTSSQMIALAETIKLRDKDNVNYLWSVFKDISSLGTFDDAVSTYVICGIGDDTEIKNTFTQIYDRLKDGGRYILLDPHPNTRESKVIGTHSKVCLDNMTHTLFDYYRPIESYTSLLKDSGFSIDDIFEPEANTDERKTIIVVGRK